MSAFRYSKITFINAKLVKDYILYCKYGYSVDEDSFISVTVSGAESKQVRVDSYCMQYEEDERLLDLDDDTLTIPIGYFDLMPFLCQSNADEKKQKGNRRNRKKLLDSKGLSYYDGLVLDALSTLVDDQNRFSAEFRPVKFTLSQLIKTISCSSETQLTDAKIEGLAESLNRLTRSVVTIRENGEDILNHYLLHVGFAKGSDAKQHEALIEKSRNAEKDDAEAFERLKAAKLKELRSASFVLCSMPVLYRYASQKLRNQLITVPAWVMNNAGTTVSATSGEFDLCVKKYLIMRIEQNQRNAKHYKEINVKSMLIAIKGREFLTATSQQKHQWAKAAVKTLNRMLAWYKGQGYIKEYVSNVTEDRVSLEGAFKITPSDAGKRKQVMKKDSEGVRYGSVNAELTRAVMLAGELKGRLDYLLSDDRCKTALKQEGVDLPTKEEMEILDDLSEKARELGMILSEATESDSDDKASSKDA